MKATTAQMAIEVLKSAIKTANFEKHAYRSWHDDAKVAIAALEQEIAHPVEPGIKQLTVQLCDEQQWTISEQQQFAGFLKRFPNESSQGIMSLGDAWKHGKACAAPQEPAAPAGYTGMSDECDFSNDTWTFKMDPGYKVGAGQYLITKIPKVTA